MSKWMQEKRYTMQTLLSSPYRAVLFDMDNTLFDFIGAMQRGSAAAAEFLRTGTGEELFSYYLRWKFHVEDHMNLQDFMIAHDCFTVEKYFEAVEVYNTAMHTGLSAYDGVHELLTELKADGYKLGIVTDAYSYGAEKRLEVTGLSDYFDVVVSYDMTGYKKPHHDPFEYALSLLECAPHDVLYVGDSIRRDVEPASAVGMTPVYAKYGDRNFFEAKFNLEIPPRTLVAENPLDILKVLREPML
ncbi:MAG: HAD family hydrolase [Methanocorpusculum sp.]|nr:HAD family hydrolase [Methanocorpusculum sp.]